MTEWTGRGSKNPWSTEVTINLPASLRKSRKYCNQDNLTLGRKSNRDFRFKKQTANHYTATFYPRVIKGTFIGRSEVVCTLTQDVKCRTMPQV
jgi:hypothetical protein